MRKTQIITAVIIWLLPYGLLSQYYYYGNQQQMPLKMAEDRLVLQIQETDASVVQDRVQKLSTIQQMKPLRPLRGIYQFNLSPGTTVAQAQSELERSLTVIRSIPAYYSIDPVGERYEFIMTDEFVVKFAESVFQEEIYALNVQHKVEILRSNQWNEYVLRLKENAVFNTLEMANIYYEDTRTIWAHPNFIVDIRLEQIDDPYFDEQWYLNNTSDNPGTPDVDIGFRGLGLYHR